nr:hypothetical protein [uncultured Roseibium sp.]
MPEAEPKTATPREIHAYLSDQLKSYHDGLIDFAFKHGVILTVILGWVVSSERAQEFLGETESKKIASLAALSLYALAHVLWVRRWYLKSNAVFGQLKDLKYMSIDKYKPQYVTKFMAGTFMAVHFAICTVIGFFIAHLG